MIQEAATELVEPKIMMRDDDLHKGNYPEECSSYKKKSVFKPYDKKTFGGKT